MVGFQATWRWFLLVSLASNVLSADPAADSKYRYRDYLECTMGVEEISSGISSAFQKDREIFAVVVSGKIFFLSSNAISVLPLERVKEVDVNLHDVTYSYIDGRPLLYGDDRYLDPQIKGLSQPLLLYRFISPGDTASYSLLFLHAPWYRDVQKVQSDSITEGNSLPAINHLIIQQLKKRADRVFVPFPPPLGKTEKVLERIKPACLRLGSAQIADAFLNLEKTIENKRHGVSP